MRRIFVKSALAMTAALVIAGCATSFQEPNYVPADWGPVPENYESIIKAHFDNLLKDSESARFRFEKPFRAYQNYGLIKGGTIKWVGYLVQVHVNAKNSFGAYTGFKLYSVQLNHAGEVYEVTEGSAPLVTVLPTY